jgi:hypothetical protein
MKPLTVEWVKAAWLWRESNVSWVMNDRSKMMKGRF